MRFSRSVSLGFMRYPHKSGFGCRSWFPLIFHGCIYDLVPYGQPTDLHLSSSIGVCAWQGALPILWIADTIDNTRNRFPLCIGVWILDAFAWWSLAFLLVFLLIVSYTVSHDVHDARLLNRIGDVLALLNLHIANIRRVPGVSTSDPFRNEYKLQILSILLGAWGYHGHVACDEDCYNSTRY